MLNPSLNRDILYCLMAQLFWVVLGVKFLTSDFLQVPKQLDSNEESSPCETINFKKEKTFYSSIASRNWVCSQYKSGARVVVNSIAVQFWQVRFDSGIKQSGWKTTNGHFIIWMNIVLAKLRWLTCLQKFQFAQIFPLFGPFEISAPKIIWLLRLKSSKHSHFIFQVSGVLLCWLRFWTSHM